MERAPRLLVQAICLLCAGSLPAHADLKINEFRVQGSELVEIYNSSPDTVSLTNWQVTALPRGGFGLFGFVPPGGFRAFFSYVGYNELPDDGATLLLVHAPSGFIADQVSYGYLGGAPSGRGTAGRYPDGNDTNDDARDFEFVSLLQGPGTPGGPNYIAAPQLGSDLLLNEVKWYSHGTTEVSAIELYNPMDQDVAIAGYWVSDGEWMCEITAPPVVPRHGYRVLRQGVPGEGLDCTEYTQMTFDRLDTIYLFRAPREGESHPVRVDQVGLVGGPVHLDPTRSFQRCTDGEGPNDGYDYPSSGGDETYFFGSPTLGATNNMLCAVQIQATTWGRVKGLYR